MKNIFLSLIVLFLLQSCSSRIFQPLYTAQPNIKSIPNINFIDEREVPERERNELLINLFEEGVPSEDDYFNNPGALKGPKGKAPTVIIAVPKEIEISGKKEKDYEENDSFNKVFKTDGYYNEAEQAIEQSLLRIGFNVLDRSKFEAKLRDLRDRANDRPWHWDSWSEKQLEDGEYDIVKDDLKKQFDERKITSEQYTERIAQIDKVSQRALPGKKRDDDEMNDIAEVIRAAQTGTDQSDYLLQINEVTVADAGDRELSIKNIDVVKDFLSENEDLKFGNLPESLPSTIPSKWLRASFNAKLIDIKSGSIVWLGSHEIESSTAEEIEVSFDIQKYVNNVNDINGNIEKHNNSLKVMKSKLEDVKISLEELYATAMIQKKLDTPTEATEYNTDIKTKISKLEDRYNSNLKALKQKADNPPVFSKEGWKYTYIVSVPIVSPDLMKISKNGIQGEQRLLKHRKKLIKSVTQSLIKTIKIK